MTRPFTPPSPHQNCRLSCPLEQGSARPTAPRRRIAIMVCTVFLGCCRNRNHRGREISIRTYFPAISRLPVLTGYFGSDKFLVRPYGKQALGSRKYLIEQTLWRRVRANFELEFDFFREFSRATGNIESSVIRGRYAPRRRCASCPTEGWAASHILHRRGAVAVLLFHRGSECRDLSEERENDGV